MRVEKDLLRGAGPAAVLSLLESGEKYGYELITLLDRRSDGILAMGQSTLYPLLYNLEAKGFIAAREELAPDTNRPRKYYRLTNTGKKELTRERQQFEHLSHALNKLGLLPA